MWNIHGIIMNGEFVERGIYPPEMDDRTDYRCKEGFDKTVRKRAEEFNDKLRAAEDTISDVTYGTLEELDVPFGDAFKDCESCQHEDVSVFVEPCKDCGEGVDNPWHLWEPVPEPEPKVWSREESWDAEVDAKIKESEAHIVEPIGQNPVHGFKCLDNDSCHDCPTERECIDKFGPEPTVEERRVPRHVECDCALEPALKNVPKESKLRCLAPAGCDAACVDDDHEGCDVKYICMADFEQCSNARREF